MHSILLLWTLILTVTTYLRLSSSFIPLVWSLPIILCYLLPSSLFPNLPSILIVVGVSLPTMLATNLTACLLDLLIPLTGRIGTEVLPDVAIAIICGVLNHMTLYPVSN